MSTSAQSWPRVTRILRDFGFYQRYSLPFVNSNGAMTRGTYVDEACNILAAGKVISPEWLSRHEECEPYIHGYQEFLNQHQWTMMQCQGEVVHKNERYVGHFDQYGFLDGKARPTFLSLKTGGIPDWCAIQEAFYLRAAQHMGWAAPDCRRMALQLKGDGTFTLREFKDPRDLSEAVTLVRAWWIRSKYGLEHNE